MKKKRTLILIGAVGILLAVQTITSFAADGKWYPEKDYHTVYIAEITKVLVKE